MTIYEGHTPPPREITPQEYWSRQHIRHEQKYDPRKKERFVKFLKEVDHEEGLGDMIVDLGSGPKSISRHFPDRARVEIDVSKKRTSLRRALNLLEVAANLDGLFDEQGNPTEPMQIVLDFIKQISAEKGSVVASDILNYIDWKKLFTALDRVLPDNWQIVINNRIDYGQKDALSDKRPTSVGEIQTFFEDTLGYNLVRSGQLPAEQDEGDLEPHQWLLYQKLKIILLFCYNEYVRGI